MWKQSANLFVRFRWLLVAELPFLIAAIIVAVVVGEDSNEGHLITVVFLSLAMGFQIIAGM